MLDLIFSSTAVASYSETLEIFRCFQRWPRFYCAYRYYLCFDLVFREADITTGCVCDLTNKLTLSNCADRPTNIDPVHGVLVCFNRNQFSIR